MLKYYIGDIMHDKLKLLLTKINLKEEKEYFKDGKLEKIICNKSKDNYIFIIDLEKPLSLDIYLKLNKLLKKHFKSAKKVSAKINCKEYEINQLVDYYRYYLNEYIKNAPLLEIFLDSNLNLKEKVLEVEISNKAEKMKFSSIKEDLEKKLNNAGFDIKIKTKINKEKEKEIQKEIELSKTAEIPKIPKKENPIIMGKEIKGKITDISNLTFEIDNVSIEAKIFNKSLFESSKSDFKIITLSLYDGIDSIYCKIFCKDKEDFDNYNNRLKEGVYYKIRGYTKNDKYSGEIVLNARDTHTAENIMIAAVSNITIFFICSSFFLYFQVSIYISAGVPGFSALRRYMQLAVYSCRSPAHLMAS